MKPNASATKTVTLSGALLLLAVVLIPQAVRAAESVPGTPSATGAVSRSIDDRLHELTSSRPLSFQALGEGLLGLLRQYPSVDLSLIERRLRKLEIDVYLLAQPIADKPGMMATITGASEFPYFLWIEVHGRDEMLRKRAEFGTSSEEENLQKLRRAGFLRRR
jgi:hypothetical protein